MTAPLAAPPALPAASLPRLLASLGGIGFLRPAPGTWGSALALPLALLGPEACLGMAAILTMLGWWAIDKLSDRHLDPSWVVIDEGAGQSLALAALPAAGGVAGILLAFLLFRLFDITKPGPVGWADRRKGTAGVMLDDLFAGAMAGAILIILHWAGVVL